MAAYSRRLPPLLRHLLALFAASAFIASSFSQQVRPDAGQLLREVQPPPALPKPPPSIEIETRPKAPPAAEPAVTVAVTAFRFSGVTAFPVSELQALLADRIGKRLDFAQLETAAAVITAYYRDRGYFGATAYLPAQAIKDGIVEINVVEGRLGRIKLKMDPEVRLKSSVALGYLDRISKDKPLNGPEVEKALLLLNDLPGIAVSGVLEPGSETGTGDLGVTITERGLLSGSVDGDNIGSRSTGEFRVGGGLSVNDPTGYGDQLTLRALQSQAGGISNVMLGYVIPVNTLGTKAELDYSALDYRLGKEFAALQASGDARVTGAKLSHALIRSRALNFIGQLGFEAKRLQDRIDSLNQVFDKRLHNTSIRLAADHIDDWLGGGANSLALAMTHGRLFLDTPSQSATDAGPIGHRTQGSFERWNYSVSRQQTIAAQWSLYAALTGQLASKNLDSSEKFTLGGPYGVRAYSVSEGAGDEGYTANVELRYAVPQTFLAGKWMVFGFLDAGQSHINKEPLPSDSDNSRKLYANGIGVNWLGYKGVSLHSSLAWRGPWNSSVASDRNPRFYLQVSASF